MRFWGIAAAVAVLAAPVAVAQGTWQRYVAATGLAGSFPVEPNRFDKWTDIAKGRVIQLENFAYNSAGNMEAHFFLQAVIADAPYDIDAKLKQELAESANGGDAAVGKKLLRHRPLRADEMILPGMRGIEIVTQYDAMGGKPQIHTSRSMYVGNKWLVVSVRHYEGDTRWPAERFFKSIEWKP